MAWHCSHLDDSFFLQSNRSGKSILSEVPVSRADRLAMSRLRLDARMLSTDSSAPDRCLQIKSAIHVDAAVHSVWLSWFHAQRNHRPATKTRLHPFLLSVGMAG